MKHLFLFYLIILVSGPAFAQKHLADSLLGIAETTTGIEKADLLNDAARYLLEYDPRSSLKYSEKSLKIAKEKKDVDHIYYALLTSADAYRSLGEYDSAVITHSHSLERYGDLISPGKLAQLHNQLGSVYQYLNNFEKAIEHLLACAEILDRFDRETMHISLKQLEISNLSNTGILFKELENYPKAREHMDKALEMSRAIGDSSRMMLIYNNIGILYETEKDYATAIDYYYEAAKLAEIMGFKANFAGITGNIGQLYFFMEDYEKALEYSFTALYLAEETGYLFGVSFSSGNIGRTYLKMGHPDLALEQILRSKEIALELDNRILLGNSYDFLSEYYALKGDFEKAFYAKNEYAALKDSIYEAEHAAKIAEIETIYQTEKKKRQIEQLLWDAQIKDLKLERRNVIVYSSVATIALLLITGFLLIGKIRQKQQLTKAEMEMKNLEMEQRLLRAQINPHFIFNALNSVQSYISANNNLKAMTYLAKFAHLMRNILENSTKPMITIEDEVTTLKLYLELEAMRFKEAFAFKINIDKKIIPSKTYIPPMLIQPFVENSIKHGFSQIKGKGELFIDFYGINGVVSCLVEDNGIGRQQALQQRNGKTPPHRSLGSQLTQERLNVLSRQRKVNAHFNIEDRLKPDGTVCGTRVLIDIPYEME